MAKSYFGIHLCKLTNCLCWPLFQERLVVNLHRFYCIWHRKRLETRWCSDDCLWARIQLHPGPQTVSIQGDNHHLLHCTRSPLMMGHTTARKMHSRITKMRWWINALCCYCTSIVQDARSTKYKMYTLAFALNIKLVPQKPVQGLPWEKVYKSLQQSLWALRQMQPNVGSADRSLHNKTPLMKF
jgi:hypothetical protein